MEILVRSVNVGMPSVIAVQRGEAILSGIRKAPLETETVFVSALGIAGDGQADLTVHGGIDKAVYAYPSEHWPWWEREHKLSCAPNTFGENLTLEGADESDVAIGDRFRWGEVVLEISQPRSPCFKLGIHAREDIPALMTGSARCGWYMRVLVEGKAPVRCGKLTRIVSTGGPNVRETFLAHHRARADLETLHRIHEAPALSRSWRESFARKIAAITG